MDCPLCRSTRVDPYARAHGRPCFDCSVCRLVFVDPAQRIGAEAERAHYGTHQNDPGDPGYRRFLGRLSVPLVERLRAGAEGLDYGSGPGPTLSRMLAEQGFRMQVFDPFFAPDASVLERTYDFITLTEVAEHFFTPRQEFDRLNRMLRPGGWLGVMTEVLTDERDFATWRYARDPTHVSFFRPATLRWLAAHYGWRLETPQRSVALFGKPPADPPSA